MALHENVIDATVGFDAKFDFGIGEEILGEIEAAGVDEEVEAGGESFRRGLAADDGGDGVEEVEGFLGEGRAGEEGHEAEEDGLVEAAGFKGHAANEGVDGEELAGAGEAEEDGGVGVVVVGEAGLGGCGVEDIERALGVGLAVDEADGVGVADEAGRALGGLGKGRGRGGSGRRWFEVLEGRDPWERCRGGG